GCLLERRALQAGIAGQHARDAGGRVLAGGLLDGSGGGGSRGGADGRGASREHGGQRGERQAKRRFHGGLPRAAMMAEAAAGAKRLRERRPAGAATGEREPAAAAAVLAWHREYHRF